MTRQRARAHAGKKRSTSAGRASCQSRRLPPEPALRRGTPGTMGGPRLGLAPELLPRLGERAARAEGLTAFPPRLLPRRTERTVTRFVAARGVPGRPASRSTARGSSVLGARTLRASAFRPAAAGTRALRRGGRRRALPPAGDRPRRRAR
jgi:hypothetical protein